MTKIQSQTPRVAVQPTSAKAPVEKAPTTAAAPEEEKESSYEPQRKKLVSVTGKHKATPIAAAARPDLAAEVMSRRSYASTGAGKTPATSPLTIAKTADAVVIKGTAGNDVIRVQPRQDGLPGVEVSSGKQKITLDEAEAKKLTIEAGAGNDKVLVDPRVSYDLTLKGGGGDDLVRGGSGNDSIHGGSGRDMVYGGEGADKLHGGGDADVIQGNGGKDLVTGGDGNDTLYGGAGDDTLAGGAGKNVVAGGAGKNTYAQGAGKDTAYHGNDDRFGREKGTRGGAVKKVEISAGGAKPAGHTIKIEGSPAFKAKVEAELESLRSTPTGRAMLEDIDKHPDKPIVIKFGQSSQSLPDNEADAMTKGLKVKNVTGTGAGTGSTVTFNADQHRVGGLERSTAPTDADDPLTMPPAIALFHELIHSHRSQLGESAGLMKKEEFETAGSVDPNDHNHRYDWKYTENKLRAELGLPDRTHYD